MEIILIIIGLLVAAGFVFVLIEYPYYLVSVYVVLHVYNFNIELPIPLDLRGLISVLLILRLIIFDKENLRIIMDSLSNKYILFILIFCFYTLIINASYGVSFTKTVKTIILNVSSLLIGYITFINGYGKRTIIFAILFVGVMATSDLIYSRSTIDILRVRRILVMIVKGGEINTLNHNFFGALCGYAFIITFSMFLSKHLNKYLSYFLLMYISFGIILSTSRMTFLTVLLTSLLVLFTKHQLTFNVRKIVMVSIVGFSFFLLVSFGSTYIFTAMNLDTDLAEKIYYRTIEEPLSFFTEDVQTFNNRGLEKHSTMEWRINKTVRDLGVLFNNDIFSLLFGYGEGGYSEIGQAEFRGFEIRRYSAHNFYTNFIAEWGLLGLSIFMALLISLIYNSIKMIKYGHLPYTLGYLLLYLLFGSVGADVSLSDEFGFILIGSVIADTVHTSHLDEDSSVSYQ